MSKFGKLDNQFKFSEEYEINSVFLPQLVVRIAEFETCENFSYVLSVLHQLQRNCFQFPAKLPLF